LALDLEYDWVIVHDVSNQVVCGLFGVVVADHPGTFIESRFEKFGSQFPLASLPNLMWYIAPYIGHENNVLEARLSTKLV